jgi:hypothetical protein
VPVTVLVDDDVVDVMLWQERLQAAEARADAAEARVAELAEQVAVLSRMLFGRSSEKSRPGVGPDADSPGGGAGEAGGSAAGKRARGQQPGSRGHGRRDYSHLETEEVIHDVAEGLRCCTDCGLEFEFLCSETRSCIAGCGTGVGVTARGRGR